MATNVTLKSTWDETPLHEAASACDFDVVAMLLQKGASIANEPNCVGQTALFYSMRRRNSNFELFVAEALLETELTSTTLISMEEYSFGTGACVMMARRWGFSFKMAQTSISEISLGGQCSVK